MIDESGRRGAGGAAANWRQAARCRDSDPDELFVAGARQRDVREMCRACPVRTECLAHALDNRIRFGVWGGMTERERRALLKRRPDVVSWSALLEAARRAALAPRPAEPAAPSEPAVSSEPAASSDTGPAAPAAGDAGVERADRRAG